MSVAVSFAISGAESFPTAHAMGGFTASDDLFDPVHPEQVSS